VFADESGYEEIYPDEYTLSRHHPFHPEDELKSNKAGALFLRHSRVQMVPAWLHNAYHDAYVGPKLPKTVKQRFLMGVFAVAGYMPKSAIDIPASIDAGEDKIRHLKFSEYKKMIKPDVLKGDYIKDSDNLRRASKFMMEFIMKQEISSINELTLEEFLLSEDRQRKKELARLIFAHIADVSTEPIKDEYSWARKKKRIIARDLDTPREAVLRVTHPFIPENIDKLHYKVLEEMAA
jgi:hypothetical protein